MSLAELLGKSISEVNEFPLWELPFWAAHFELRAEEREER